MGFGGIPIIRLSMEDAVAVLRRALERGVTLFDTANLYMDSEEKFGRASLANASGWSWPLRASSGTGPGWRRK